MSNKEVSLTEIMKCADLAVGLDLDIAIEQFENPDVDLKVELEGKSEKETDGVKANRCHIPPMEINCDLEVRVGSENKIIYVCPGKLQYFTATAKKCSGDEAIEIEYCGHNKKCIDDESVIFGCLGYYKIVESGIIFIPRRNLSEFPDKWFPADILCFKAKSKCAKDVKFKVVFTYSRCVDCECRCSK